MVLYLLLISWVLSFLVGVVLGLCFGFEAGYRYPERWKLWQCMCKTEKKCRLFGTFEEAGEVAIDCPRADDEICLVEAVSEMDKDIRDVRNG